MKITLKNAMQFKSGAFYYGSSRYPITQPMASLEPGTDLCEAVDLILARLKKLSGGFTLEVDSIELAAGRLALAGNGFTITYMSN